VVQHDADIQQPKREGGKREEIHGYHLVEVIVQEALPGLGTAASGWANDVFANRPLGDAKAQFEQFPVNAGSAPKRIGSTHLPDELAKF